MVDITTIVCIIANSTIRIKDRTINNENKSE